MRGAIHPFSQYVLMAWCLVNHRDNFTFIKSRLGRDVQYACGDEKWRLNVNGKPEGCESWA
jgi:hypothetical protein